MNPNRRLLVAAPSVAIAALVVVACAPGCSIKLNDVVQDTKETLTCEGFTANGQVDADLDANVKVFLEATADVEKLSVELRDATRIACARIAGDLGAADDWSAVNDPNESTKRACNAASAKIDAILGTNARANVALVVTRGRCHQDFEQIKECDTKCKKQEVCDSGGVETRCEPGQVSLVCEGKCRLSAECEGTAEVAANCMGKCESTCLGECHGTCTKADGTRTENDPSCNGKCSAACNGKCRGVCKVEASGGIECGLNVRCKGECEGRTSDPVCETRCTPPKCAIDTVCFDSCSTRVETRTVCEPTRVELFCDGKVSVEVQKLQATVTANLGTLFDAAEVKGKRTQLAAEKLSAIGEVVVNAAGKTSVKSNACAAAGAKAAVAAAARVKVGVEGSVAVVNACDRVR